jgi:hypothetical protein
MDEKSTQPADEAIGRLKTVHLFETGPMPTGVSVSARGARHGRGTGSVRASPCAGRSGWNFEREAFPAVCTIVDTARNLVPLRALS